MGGKDLADLSFSHFIGSILPHTYPDTRNSPGIEACHVNLQPEELPLFRYTSEIGLSIKAPRGVPSDKTSASCTTT